MRKFLAYVVLLCLAVGPTLATEYRIRDLGTLGGNISQANGINSSGVVVGITYAASDSVWHAFAWQAGVMTDLGRIGGDARATEINNQGQIAGWSSIGNGVEHAWLWQNGTMTDLGTLGGKKSYAYGINNVGQVVGEAYGPNGDYDNHAALWQNGTIVDLGRGNANAINDLGQAVGRTFTAGNYHAVLWENQTVTDLGTFGGNSAQAYDVNNLSQVVGISYKANGSTRAFVWQNGSATELATLGGSSSRAFAVNNLGQVVGTAYDSRGRSRAALWQNGTVTDLGTLGGATATAWGINDLGQIVGHADLAGNGGTHAVLWEPVPEPSSLLALAGGLISLIGIGRRRA